MDSSPATDSSGELERLDRNAPEIGRLLDSEIAGLLNRRPSIGFALGVSRDRSLEYFHGHGLADIASAAPVTEDTVFRIGSLTKTLTAVAIMQLAERGRVDLDGAAAKYLRGFRLVPAGPDLRPPAIRHLLTHTAGIPEVLRVSDLFHPRWGAFGMRPAALSVEVGAELPSLGEYHRGGLRYVVEPGTAFAYTNHGFATLGQIVEDVSGLPLDRYLREHIFEPLGMRRTDLLRPQGSRSSLATGYEVGSRGPVSVTDRRWIGEGAGGVYSSTRDMARFAAALAGGGSNEHGRILEPAGVAEMMEAHHQPHPRIPGVGLGLFRHDAGGCRVVGHDGRLPGFNAQLLVAPDPGLGVVAFTNGSPGATSWMPTELGALLRRLLGVPSDVIRADVPQRPDLWGELCGRYRLPPKVSDLRGRLASGGGVEVLVRGGRLWVRVAGPLPVLRRGVPLHPDDPADPLSFRMDLSRFGMAMPRVVFERGAGSPATALHTDLGMLTLHRRPAAADARRSSRSGTGPT